MFKPLIFLGTNQPKYLHYDVSSNLLCHVRIRYTYDMVPLETDISFATGTIISHKVEEEPNSIPLIWPISRVKCLGCAHSKIFPSFVLNGGTKPILEKCTTESNEFKSSQSVP